MNKKFNWKLSKVVKLLLLDRLIGLGVLCCILIGLYEIIFLNFNFIYLILTLCFLSIAGYYMVKLIFKNQNIFWKSFIYSLASHTIQFISLFIILYSLGIVNNYLEIMVYNENSSSKHIIRYDQSSSQFNHWEFKSDGGHSFWTGKWNDIEKSMTWNYIDFSNSGINGKIIENFSSDSVIKIKTVMKDKTGKTLLRVNSTKKRI